MVDIDSRSPGSAERAREQCLLDRIADLEGAVRARDELLAVTAHELRNPMHALLLQISASVAVARKTGQAELVQRLERTRSIMDRFIKRASLLLEATRIHAHRSTLNLESVDLAEVAREIADSYLPEAVFHRVESIDVSATGNCRGVWDRLAVEQILSNLISNAIKYGAGAPVAVVLSQTHAPPGVRLEVIDRGIGVAPADQPRIFERFEQVLNGQRRREGFGLGLWLVRRLVEAHQGTISLASAVGKGSTFTVWLPLESTSEGGEV
jgi:two-component system, OmpR family, sensor kinase